MMSSIFKNRFYIWSASAKRRCKAGVALRSVSMKAKFILFFFGFIFSYPLFLVHASFPDLGVSVRPMGMGGAYIGVAEDASAPLWNPAGLIQIRQRELITTYSALYVGLNAQLFTGAEDRLGYHFVSYAHPIRTSKDVVAVSWLFFDSAFYDEQTYVFTYAKRLTPQLSGGVGTKILHVSIASNEYTRADPDLANAPLAQTGATIDLSLLYALSDRVQIGISGENLLPTEIGILQTEDLPMKWGVGVAHRTENWVRVIDFVWRDQRVNAKQDINIRLGIERWLFQRQVGIRAGYNVRTITVGASYRYGKRTQAQLDYAFLFPIGSISDTFGSHRVGLSVRF